MNKELVKRLSGLGLLAVVAVLTTVLQGVGEAQRPQTYQLPFERGTELSAEAQSTLGQAIQDALVRHDARIVVAGHTGTRGDAEANLALSEQRADDVVRRLVDAGIEPERIDSVGVGGAQPLEQQPDESDRAYQRRLSRALITVAP
ncbi:OmpA family protein [Saccharospirillum salsuginis]|uniref:OmpA-like domain-containing protein n=1 Tax=Saccharospirillum salsuginis TaxID=418750 RepID=A0A918KG61_9GAMM|nr:OmpA family protein [Saccharospirillum salsuginis]GGX62572.1 hypothetical protein GCM10007392_33090 [Saccharospirillum salsuginis]